MSDKILTLQMVLLMNYLQQMNIYTIHEQIRGLVLML